MLKKIGYFLLTLLFVFPFLNAQPLGNDSGVKKVTASTTYWWNDQIFYEIFVRSFYDSDGNGIGDFNGLIQKLDYLNSGSSTSTGDLGITAVWLMPIMKSPSYHGYDVTDYYTANSGYGTNAQFKAFVDSAHARGIKVIIDMVINHTSDQHPWFTNSKSGPSASYRNWYVWSSTNPGYKGPWGEQVWYSYGGYYYYGVFTNSMPDLNYFNTAVKTEVSKIVDYWLDTLKVDGFRLDGARYICEDGTILADAPSTLAYWREFRTHYKAQNPDAMTVGEVWTSSSSIIPYVDGTGIDFCFEFDAASDIVTSITGLNPSSIKSHMDKLVTIEYPFLQYGTFLSNHDQQRIISQLSGNRNYAKLGASLLLTLPGVPFIYYGEELGMTSSTDDPSKRTPMQWTNGKNSGFSTGTPWKSLNTNYTTVNVQIESADSTSLLSWYKQLIRLRKQLPSLRRGDYCPITSANGYVYSFMRSYVNKGAQEIVIPVHNFYSSPVSNPALTIAAHYMGLLTPGTYSLQDLVTGTDAGQFVLNSDGSAKFTPTITLGPEGTALLKAQLVTAVQESATRNMKYGFHLGQNYPNPFNPTAYISYAIPQAATVRLIVYNTLGQEVSVLVDERQAAGTYKAAFNASALPSGIYFYKLEAGGYSETRKMVLCK